MTLFLVFFLFVLRRFARGFLVVLFLMSKNSPLCVTEDLREKPAEHFRDLRRLPSGCGFGSRVPTFEFEIQAQKRDSLMAAKAAIDQMPDEGARLSLADVT